MRISRCQVGGFLALTAILLSASDNRAGQAAPNAPAAPLIDRSQVSVPESVMAAAPKLRASADFGRMPLYFIANEGQHDSQVSYYIQGADKTLYFTRQGVTYVLNGPHASEAKDLAAPASLDMLSHSAVPECWAVKLDFVGASADVTPVGREKTEAVISYFRESQDQWKTGIPTYSRVLYPNLWPGIDLAYSGSTQELKYQFAVAPGVDPGRIRLAYRGASAVTLNEAGELEVRTPAGGFRDAAPEAYQEIAGKRVSVEVSYALEPAASGLEAATYGFRLGAYDAGRPLVIDPAVVVYCGYIGGASEDYAYGVAADGNGAAYVTGRAYSGAGFPVSVGPDTTHNGNFDAFIAKVNSQGTGFLYCGFIGGSGMDVGTGVAVDANGNAFVIGQTQSSETSFPEIVGPDLSHNGGWDVFVAKVNSAGTGLVYCGYVGGSLDDFPAGGGQSGSGIAIDDSGNAYIAGNTSSTETSFPVGGGPDVTHNGDSDAFVAKVNAGGTSLAFCGYLGSLDGYEFCNGLALDASGSLYIAGYVGDDPAFPRLVGPDLTHNGSNDTFVAKLSPSGNAWVYCGFIGGSGDDRGWAVAVDGAGCAYVTGHTTSTNLPVSGGLDASFNGYQDVFVAKVNPGGSGLMYCGYIGGTGDDKAYNIAVDGAGCAYVTGLTASSETNGFPVTVGPDLTYNSGTDAYLAKIDPAGSGLVYCGYVGGADGDYGRGVAVDKCANAFVVGDTYSTQTTFPETVGPDTTFNALGDGFVAKVSSAVSGKNTVAADIDGDNRDEIVGDFDHQGLWYHNDGSWTQVSGVNVENLAAADVDGDNADEVIGDFGPVGLWLWGGGAWTQLSGVNCDAIVPANIDGDLDDELIGDFGPTGLWLWNSGSWLQLSGVNVEQAAVFNLDGGGDEIVGDFGTVGLWFYGGGGWTQLSGVNAEFVLGANVEGTVGDEIIGDFGPLGIWRWMGTWAQISTFSAELMVAADSDGSGDREVFADLGPIGLWLWDSWTWSQISSLNVDFLTAADLDGGADEEIVADLGAMGLWGFDGGSWGQLSPSPAEHIFAADVDGNGTEELVADLNYLGLWLRNGGAWSQLR